MRPTRPYHEHNAARERPRVLAELAAGKSVGLISDAGTPLISDPGYKLVREAIAAGFAVTAIPGPSAPLAALVSAGLATDAFLFAGFLPPRRSARKTRLEELKAVPATLVFFEAPSRLADSLAICCRSRRPRAAVARELTAAARGGATRYAGGACNGPPMRCKGEMVILVGPTRGAVTDLGISAGSATARRDEPQRCGGRWRRPGVPWGGSTSGAGVAAQGRIARCRSEDGCRWDLAAHRPRAA